MGDNYLIEALADCRDCGSRLTCLIDQEVAWQSAGVGDHGTGMHPPDHGQAEDRLLGLAVTEEGVQPQRQVADEPALAA